MPKQLDEMTAQEAAAVLERSDRYVQKLAYFGKLGHIRQRQPQYGFAKARRGTGAA